MRFFNVIFVVVFIKPSQVERVEIAVIYITVVPCDGIVNVQVVH